MSGTVSATAESSASVAETIRRADEVAVGDSLPETVIHVSRADLIAYAGASGDHNPIHWNERVAGEAGLPGVIAHGMWTMGAASRALVAWAGDPTAVASYSCRFSRPVLVPDPGRAEVVVSGSVRSLDSESRTAVVALRVTVDGSAVLAKAQATMRLG